MSLIFWATSSSQTFRALIRIQISIAAIQALVHRRPFMFGICILNFIGGSIDLDLLFLFL